MFATKKAAEQFHGGCTQTSKMPCKSYSLPTASCNVGSKLAKIEGSICSGCYANKGNYVRYAKNIIPIQVKRLNSIGAPEWVDAMVKSLSKETYFRWHDSGDLQGIEHLAKIAEIARRLPNCQFWLPTREYGVVKSFMRENEVPANLTIRLSAYFPDELVKPINNLPMSRVHKKSAPVGFTCPAPENSGECGDCRACWNATVKVISYKYH